MKSTAVELWHSTVQLAYFTCVLVVVMAAFEPVYTALALVGGIVFGLRLRGIKESLRPLVWQLPLVLLIFVVNPFFSAYGSTVLFTIGDRRVYLESLLFGLNMGAMLFATLTWFRDAESIITTDKALAAFGNVAPTIALIVSMMVRLVPEFVTRGHEIDDIQRACSSSGKAATGFGARSRLVTVLVAWALEDSFQTVDSMRARGWNAGSRRTVYRREVFRRRDAAAFACLISLTVLDIITLVVACSSFSYYPSVSGLSPWWFYLPHAVVVFLPLALFALDDLRWARVEAREALMR